MRRLNTVVILLMLAFALPIKAEVRAYTDRSRGAVDAPFLLTVEATQTSAAAIDLSPLEKAFKVLGSRKSALSSFSNGGNQISQRWLITLAPRHGGELVLPALQIGNEQTPSLRFEALSTGTVTSSSALQLETSIDLPIIYVRSAATLSVRLAYLNELNHAEISEPLVDGVRIYPLGEQIHFKEQRQGELYRVIEQRYLLLPERAERFELPPLRFVGRDIEGKAHEAKSKPLTFEALPLPAQAKGARLNATEVRLESQWLDHQAVAQPLQVGELVKRVVTIKAHNLPADWLPELNLEATPGLKIKALPAQLQEGLNNGILVSTRSQIFEILPTEAGEQRISPISVRWWDSIREQSDVSRLEGISIMVLPFSPQLSDAALPKPAVEKNDRMEATPPKKSDAASDHAQDESNWLGWFWAAVAFICAAGWSLTHSRHQRQVASNEALKKQLLLQRKQDARHQAIRKEQEAFARLNHACRYADPRAVFDALIHWAQLFWPQHSITGLSAIEQLADAPTLTYLLRDLDARLREGELDEPWYGDLALKQIARLRNQRLRESEAAETMLSDSDTSVVVPEKVS